MNLVVNEMMKLQHVNAADRYSIFKRLARSPVIQYGFSILAESSGTNRIKNLGLLRAVKDRRSDVNPRNVRLRHPILVKIVSDGTEPLLDCRVSLANLLAEQTRRLYEQHDNKTTEYDSVRELCRDIRSGEDLDNAEDDSSYHGARNGSDPTEYRRRKGFDTGHGTRRGHERGICGAKQDSRDGCQAGTDGKGHGNGTIHIDSHQLCGTLVLRHRPHGLADLRLVGKERQDDHDHDIGKDRYDRRAGDRYVSHREIAEPNKIGERLGVGCPDEKCCILQKIGHTDRRDEYRQRRCGTKRLIRQLLDHDSQKRTYSDRKKSCRNRRPSPVSTGTKSHISANHDNITMSKVQHLGNAVHHGIAQGNDRIHAS